MTRDLDDEPMTPADFQALFGDEPLAPDPRADLDRGRSRRRRRTGGVVALVAVVALGGTAGAVLLDGVAPLGPVSPPSAVPSTPPAGPDPVPSASRTAAPAPAPRDTAPALRRDARGSYLDADGHTLGAPVGHRDPDVHPFRATTKNSWRLAVRHLDPSRDHLGDYEVDNFSGGSGEAGVEIGQKIGWTVRGDRGEGMVQLAVTRAAPGVVPRLGPGHDDAVGFCNDTYLPAKACRRTTVAGVAVYLAKTSDGGFVMDRRQEDGEVASIVVSPLFGNNTSVALHSMGITTTAAAGLLDDPALDVVG